MFGRHRGTKRTPVITDLPPADELLGAAAFTKLVAAVAAHTG